MRVNSVREEVLPFRYLWSTVRDDNRFVTEISSRIAKGCRNFRQINNDIKHLVTFHMKCLRTILRVKWQVHVPNSDILRRTGRWAWNLY
ncbi:unnamed protein product [Arctia plantaginis]|uniref:Uncharacterized protein n=1 Tax=Arctia plantaginis TaxID=874455 RepID=A0A8S0ZT51_ARCPL|nr:unnamed protein product [Arctia plantaginis]